MKHKSIYNKHLFHLIHHLIIFTFDTHFSNLCFLGIKPMILVLVPTVKLHKLIHLIVIRFEQNELTYLLKQPLLQDCSCDALKCHPVG